MQRKFTKKQQQYIDYVYKTLSSLGYDRYSISGILGNALTESGLDADSVSKSKTYSGGWQNHKTVRQAIEDQYGDYSLKNQLKYIHDWNTRADHIIKGKYSPYTATNAGKYKTAGYKTAKEAADAFMKLYERPVIMKNGKIVGYQGAADRYANADEIYNYLNTAYKPEGGIQVVTMPDGNKTMTISPRMYERPQYEPEFKLYRDPKTVYLLNPAAREVPESLDAWNGADSPSKGPRMPNLTKQLDDLQRDNPLNGGFKPETTIYGRRRLSPLSLKLPSLDQMLDLGSPQQQMTQYFADALQVPRMHLDIAPLQTFKNGKLPKYEDGTSPENSIKQGVPVDDEYYNWYNNWLSNRAAQFDENYQQASDLEKQQFSERNSESINQQLQNIRNARMWTDRKQYVDESPERIYHMKGVDGVVRYGTDGNRIYVIVPGLRQTYGDHYHDTLMHEISHSLHKVPSGVDYGDARKDALYTAGIRSPQTSKINSINKEHSDSLYAPGYSPNSYEDNPDEILSELNEYRKRVGLDPKYEVTSDDLLKWRSAKGKNEMPDTLQRFSDEVLLRYFNEVAQNNSYSNPYRASDARILPRAKNGKLPYELPKYGIRRTVAILQK